MNFQMKESRHKVVNLTGLVKWRSWDVVPNIVSSSQPLIVVLLCVGRGK